MTLPSPKIVAIGGGEIRTGETLPFDREIVAFTGKARPRALFVPTASNDSEGYEQVFKRVYGEQLGCDTDALRLLRQRPDDGRIRDMIAASDLIYVGGGNTRSMLGVWRREGLDLLLVAAAKQGKVLCGLSAGALCWFRFGNSDAPMIEGSVSPKTMRVDGLGLIDAAICPHLVSEGFRKEEFSRMMETTPTMGIGLDDHSALQILGGSFRVLSTVPREGAHRFFRRGSGIVIEDVMPGPYRPLTDLLS